MVQVVLVEASSLEDCLCSVKSEELRSRIVVATSCTPSKLVLGARIAVLPLGQQFEILEPGLRHLPVPCDSVISFDNRIPPLLEFASPSHFV